MEATQQLAFGPFCLDLVTHQLWRDEQLVELQPRPLAVLQYLAQRPGQVVSKEELLKHVWAGTYVTKTVLKVSIRAIREALEDEVNAPRYIETVGREGYRFLGEVRGLESSVRHLRTPAANLQHPTSILVGRDAELTQLHQWLGKVLRGERQLVFVTGEPGVGKTTLVDAFLSRTVSGSAFHAPRSSFMSPAQSSVVSSQSPPYQFLTPALIGRGQCLEQYGEGEAYLPMLEALGQLCRGSEGQQILAVLRRYAPTWLVQMPSLIGEAELENLHRKVVGATRERMLREMAEALEALATERTLLLVLEDLHVSDRSTVELLAYLAQRREPAKLFVIGTYRPIDVVIRDHPLKAIKQELDAHGHCEELRVELLGQADVEEYVIKRLAVDAVPAELTQLIYQRTDGNALFMVNIVDYCLQQNLLVQKAGQWVFAVEATELGMPESVQQIIAKQVERLTEHQQRLLEVASVVGEEFTAAAVAAALQSEVDVVEEACEELAQKSQFLQEVGIAEWPDGTLSGRYAFRHVLYQNALYGRIAEVRRVRLHRLIGERQELGHGSRAKEIAAELAMHFEQGRDYRRTVFYLHKAGTNAIHRNAHREAIHYLTKGLASLQVLPENTERNHQELSLQLTLGLPLVATRGYAAPEVEQVYTRSLFLCKQIGQTPLSFPALVGFWALQLVRGQLESALGIASQGLHLAQQEQNPAFLLEAHLGLGMISYFMGNLRVARTHLEEGVALAYNLDRTGRPLTAVQDSEVGCLTYTASALWHLGYADQARMRMNEALTLARELSHPFSEVFALTQGAGLYLLCGDLHTFHHWLDEAITLAQEQGFPLWVGLGTALNGWALIEEGHINEGMARVRQGLEIYQAIGTELSKSFFLLLLAEAHQKVGQVVEGLTLLAQTQEFVERTGERIFETELYRLKGALLLAQSSIQGPASEVPTPQPTIRNPQLEAEECFLKAIDIARQQQTKSQELRAVMGLVRLRQQQALRPASRTRHGSRSTQHATRLALVEAHRMLSEVYDWFTEGFDTKNLQEARTLLEELSH